MSDIYNGNSNNRRVASAKGVPTKDSMRGRGLRLTKKVAKDTAFDNTALYADRLGGRGAPPTGGLNSAIARQINPLIKRKRGGITQHTGRVTSNLGGNGPTSLAKMRRHMVGRSFRPPPMTVGNPQIGRFGRTGEQLPRIDGFAGKPDPFFRGQTPMGSRGQGGFGFQGFPARRPAVWDAANRQAGFSEGLRETASSSRFIKVGAAGPNSVRAVIPNPATNYPFQQATNRIQNTNKTGDPNSLVKYTHHLTPGAAEFCMTPQVHHIWFTPKMLNGAGRKRSGNSHLVGPVHTSVHQGYNLVVTNYMLACSQFSPREIRHRVTADQILNQWKLSGAIAAEQGVALVNRTDVSHSSVNRLVVIQYQGPINVLNVWGRVKIGDVVGFMLKGVPVSSIYAHTPSEHGSYNLNATDVTQTHAISTVELSGNPLQMIPWFGPIGSRPLDSELSFHDDWNTLRIGKWIQIGSVVDVVGQISDMNTIARAPFSASATLACGLIRIQIASPKEY